VLLTEPNGPDSFSPRRGITDAMDVESISVSEETYRGVGTLSTLQNAHRQIKMAYLGGNNYVYYPATSPDPDSAMWVKLRGKKQ
jgi:hypothetical protein